MLLYGSSNHGTESKLFVDLFVAAIRGRGKHIEARPVRQDSMTPCQSNGPNGSVLKLAENRRTMA